MSSAASNLYPTQMNDLQSIIATFQEHSTFALVILALLSWLAQSYYNSKARQLKQFPAVGSTLPLLSLIGTFNYIKSVNGVVEAGIRKWPGRIFKIPTPTDWWVIVTDPKHISEIAKAPDDVWSFVLVVDEHVQTRFTVGPQITENPYHVPIVKNQLTRAIPKVVPTLYDEIVTSINECLPPADDCTSIKVLENMVNVVSRASNRVFVGAPLCRDSEWLKLNIDFTRDVVQTAFILSLFPSLLRPVVNFFISKVAQRYAAALELLRPAIAAHRDERENGTERVSDLLTWLLDEANDEEQQDHFLIARVFIMNFASIHTTSMAATQALFDLASFPEYAKPLREEIEAVTKQEGWTKAGLDQMHKLDSFIKESQRLHPAGTFMLIRLAVNDYTFSDGTTIPAGTIVAVPTLVAHLDSENYEDPLTFDGFRFVKLKERAILDGQPDKKFDFVATGVNSLGFSHGRHACPGRFFAAAEIKLILAHLVMNYDMKLAGGVRPVDRQVMHHSIPDPSAEVLFTRR